MTSLSTGSGSTNTAANNNNSKAGGAAAAARHPRVLRCQNKHVVQQVADRLLSGTSGDGTNNSSSNVHRRAQPPPLVKRSLELYRVLETRVKVGTLGRHDKCQARAACVLHHVQRTTQQRTQSQSQSPWTWRELASASAVKDASHLEQLYRQVCNFLQPRNLQVNRHQPPAGQASGRGGEYRGLVGTTPSLLINCGSSRTSMLGGSKATLAASEGNGNGATSGIRPRRSVVSESDQPPTPLLSDLAIRLAGHEGGVGADPFGSSRRASELLARLYRRCSSSSSSSSSSTKGVGVAMSAAERRGLLYDLRRNWCAYQAAAFYCCCCAAAEGGGKSKKRSSKVSRKRKNEEDDDLANDDDGSNIEGGGGPPAARLELQDVFEAAQNSFTFLELKECLPMVQQFVLEEEKEAGARDGGSNRGADDDRRRHKRTKGGRSGGNSVDDDLVNHEAGSALADAVVAEDDDDWKAVERSFRNWEGQVLKDLVERAKLDLGIGFSNSRRSSEDDSAGGAAAAAAAIDDEEALEHLANQVLSKHNLLPA